MDVGVDLAPHAYTFDLGSMQGTIPEIACDPTIADACAGQTVGTVQASMGGGMATAHLACDPSTARCYAQASAVQSFPVKVLQEDGFIPTIERWAVVIVRSVDVAYHVPVNTLTFPVPEIRVSVGPKTESDAGVVPIGATIPVAAGATIGDPPRHLVLKDDTPARALIEDSIRHKRTFVILAGFAPRLEAGAPIPAGQLEVDLSPHLTVGPP
jgi:hypothetical protein